MSEIREHAREPWWQVVAVFGHDDDEGDDFAYTVGLAERGIPELHLWCRPVEGEDPGHDWQFSMRDMGGILNELAWRLIDERVQVGDTWETEYDAGLVSVRFRLDPAVEASTVEAFQAMPAPVHPVRWSLHRKPVGPSRPMTAQAMELATREYATLAGDLSDQDLPAPWRVPDAVTWDVDQRWGPRTPLVLAHALRLASSSSTEMIALVNLSFAMEFRNLSGYPLVVARSAARDVGRAAAIERLESDAFDLIADLGATWACDSWRSARDWLDDGDDEPLDGELLRQMVGLILSSHLATVAVADALADEHVLAGLGPILSCYTDWGIASDERWLAAPHVIKRATEIVRAAGATKTVAAAVVWALQGDEASASARGTVSALMARSASAFPPYGTAIRPRSLARRLDAALASAGAPPQVLQSWLSTLCVVLTHRAVLDADELEPVMRAAQQGMPGAALALNDPLVG